jgi:hypothetical protein
MAGWMKWNELMDSGKAVYFCQLAFQGNAPCTVLAAKLNFAVDKCYKQNITAIDTDAKITLRGEISFWLLTGQARTGVPSENILSG